LGVRLKEREILLIESLSVYFYTYSGIVKAVEDLDLSIYEGECFGLVGETGCGKSTLMKAVLRLIPPPGKIVKGKVLFKGIDLTKLSEQQLQKIRGYKISMVFQEPSSALDPLFNNGYQIVETILSHEKIAQKNAWKKALSLLRTVKIPEAERRLYQYPHELSGGMKQRIVISIALAGKPDIIIADEPTTALDVTIQAQILDLLKELQKKYKTTLVIITHNLGIVAEYCDRIGVMYAGKLIELGSTLQIFENPLHPYTKGLLAAVPKISSKREKLASIPGTVPNLINPPSGCRFHPRCRYATDRCKKEVPKLLEVEPGHKVACHLYNGENNG